MTGCARNAPLIRHQPVVVERLVFVPVPADLTRPTGLPALPQPGANGALLAERDAYREAWRQCNADKARIAGIEGRTVD